MKCLFFFSKGDGNCLEFVPNHPNDQATDVSKYISPPKSSKKRSEITFKPDGSIALLGNMGKKKEKRKTKKKFVNG